MSVSKQYIPKLCCLKKRNLAYVTLNGRRVYLGKQGTPEARAKYDRVIARWIAGGRAEPAAKRVDASYLIEDLVADYWDYLQKRYARSREPREIRYALRTLLEGHSALPVGEFTQQELTSFRDRLIAADLCRLLVNRRTYQVRRMFKWGASQGLVPIAVAHALATVETLRANENGVRESIPVEPVDRGAVDAVLPHLSRQVAAMVEIQWQTGMRPGEVVAMRRAELKTIDGHLCYSVVQHKTRHRGRKREIPIVPTVQALLTPFLLRPMDAFLFDPREALAEYRANASQRRKSKVQPSQVARRERARRASKQVVNDRYTVESYGRAIARACERASVERWSPNQLRHAAATRIANKLDLLAASYVLGHSSTTTTQIYAKTDVRRAREVMEQMG